MTRIRIALVEDNPQFLSEVSVLLAESPLVEVGEAYTTGEAALKGISQTPPDVALIDLGLPGLSGVEVVRGLKERGCQTECLVLTAYDDDAHLFAALEAGAVGYIVKDEASLPKLIEAIQDARHGGAPMSMGIARRLLDAFRERARRAQNPHLEETVTGEIVAGIIGGVIGGLAGTIGAWLTGYWGPRKLEEEREKRAEERVWGPRKKLIKEMLDNAAPGKGRSFETLKRVTGTPDEDLRRLLVELGARGFTRPDGKEAWDYTKNRPLEKQEG